jgi:ATP-dependent exoDNAse (exonuclease V) beta subunit
MSVHAAKGLQFPAVVVVDRWTEKKKLQAPAVFYENDSRLLDIGYAIDGIGTTDRSKAPERFTVWTETPSPAFSTA